MTLAEVRLWGRSIGVVSLEDGGRVAAFQYDPAFAASGIEVSPIAMPLSDRIYLFSELPERTYYSRRNVMFMNSLIYVSVPAI